HIFFEIIPLIFGCGDAIPTEDKIGIDRNPILFEPRPRHKVIAELQNLCSGFAGYAHRRNIGGYADQWHCLELSAQTNRAIEVGNVSRSQLFTFTARSPSLHFIRSKLLDMTSNGVAINR